MSKNNPNPFNAQLDRDVRVCIIQAEWNGHITGELTSHCVDTLKKHGIDERLIDTFLVPGAVELTFAASQAIETGAFDVIIVLGCVIRGDTPHFDYVCQSVTQGVTHLNAECDIPVIFGVLTVENEQQAIDRTGRESDKGAEAAEAAIKMVDYMRRLDTL